MDKNIEKRMINQIKKQIIIKSLTLKEHRFFS